MVRRLTRRRPPALACQCRNISTVPPAMSTAVRNRCSNCSQPPRHRAIVMLIFLAWAAIASRSKSHPFMKNKTNNKKVVPSFQVNESISLEEQIAQRAHEIWQQRSREHGHDLANWFRAEREINEWHQQRLHAQVARQQKALPLV